MDGQTADVAHQPSNVRATGASTSPPNRFTIDGDARLEEHLETLCQRVRTEVCALVPKPALEGLVLAGGYGRGEGGVLRTGSGDQAYNDLEFYVFVTGNAVLAERKYRLPLHRLGQSLSPAAGLEVEFKVLTLTKLRSAGPSMFFYDLLAAHRWILGDDSLLVGCAHHSEARNVPLHEATRLLMNRCTGLLFSAERLRRKPFGAEESDFVGRNLAKMQLALGDVLLAAAGQYHWSCRERHQRLLGWSQFPDARWREPICRHHAAGVEFKLHPVRSVAARESLERQHAELGGLAKELWLWLEAARLGTTFASPRAYALSATNKCPETSSLRNRLVNAKTFGPMASLHSWAVCYPRQRLLHALSLLLWEASVLSDNNLLNRVQRELKTAARDFAGLVTAYEQLWHRFN